MSNLVNTKNKKIILGLVLLVVIIGASYGVYAAYFVSEPESPESNEPETITVVDVNGDEIIVTLPVERIVSLSKGLAEVIYAVGAGDLIVGRDSGTIFPPPILAISEVGGSSYSPNLELILEKEPDLIVADTMLNSNEEVLTQLRDASIPVYIEQVGNYTRITQFITDMGVVLNREANATEVIEYISDYDNLVKDRVSNLAQSEKPTVYIEWNKLWRTLSETSGATLNLAAAGGMNIAVTEEMNASNFLSPEFVVESNPDMIFRQLSKTDGDLTVIQEAYNEILSRTVLSETNAVKNEQIYVYDSVIYTGMRNPIGLLYFAKWLHPDLFEDIDPDVVQAELIQKFFGVELECTYTYP